MRIVVEQPPEEPSAAEVLAGAEREMVEDELGLFRELMAAAAARVSGSEELTEEEMRREIEALIAERPELREVAERLAVRTSFALRTSRPSAKKRSTRTRPARDCGRGRHRRRAPCRR